MFFRCTLPAIAVLNPAQVAGQARGSFADDHLASVRSPAEAGGHVQRRAAVAAVRHADGLPGVDADPDFQRQARSPLPSPRANRAWRSTAARIAWRADVNTASAFVASNLDQVAAMSLDTVGDQLDELGGEPGSRLVSVLLGEAGVAAHVGDEERAYACLFVGHDPSVCPWPAAMRTERAQFSATLALDPVALGRYAAGRCLFG